MTPATNLTLEERERRAYADGDVAAAALLAAVIDAGAEVVAEREDAEQRYDAGHDDGYAAALGDVADLLDRKEGEAADPQYAMAVQDIRDAVERL